MRVASIDGKQVYDPVSDLWIPYKTASDALIAHLSLHHDIPLRAIDLFLDAIQSPLFDFKELTFENAGEIDTRVSEHREELSVARASVGHRHTTAGIPHVVYDLLVNGCAEKDGDLVSPLLYCAPRRQGSQPCCSRAQMTSAR